MDATAPGRVPPPRPPKGLAWAIQEREDVPSQPAKIIIDLGCPAAPAAAAPPSGLSQVPHLTAAPHTEPGLQNISQETLQKLLAMMSSSARDEH